MKLKLNYSDRNTLLKAYLLIMNQLLPIQRQLTPTEIDLAIAFGTLPEKYKWAPFSIPGKNHLYQTLGRQVNKSTLNNQLASMAKKGFLKRDEDRVLYLPKYLTQLIDTLKANTQTSVTLEFNLKSDEKKD